MRRWRQLWQRVRLWHRIIHRPRRACPLCRREYAATTIGVWKHKCQPLLPELAGDPPTAREQEGVLQ